MELVGLYAYHCFLLCALFSWAMIRRDGMYVPARTSAVVLAVTVIAPLLQPHLLPWPFDADGSQSVIYTARSAAITSALGLVAGGAVSMLPALLRSMRKDGGTSPPQLDRASWLLIGAGVGWQAVVSILALLVIWMIGCGIFTPADRRSAEKREPMMSDPGTETVTGPVLERLALPCVVLIHLCLWRQTAGLYA